MSGKGDTQRPTSVDAETFAGRWARTFGDRHAGLVDRRLILREANVREAERIILGTPDAPVSS